MDYPAAHSMDTDWYAVDACGHVAALSSGEEGAVPEDAAREIEALHTDEKSIVDILPALDPAHLVRLARLLHNCHLRETDAALLLIEDADAAADFLREASIVLTLPDGRRLAGLDEARSDALKEKVAALHAADACAGCTHAYGLALTFTRLDVFQYDHVGFPRENPYLLKIAPARPATIDDLGLTPEQRADVEGVRVAGCFKDRFLWHPAETHACSYWGARVPRIQRPWSGELLRRLWWRDWW